MTKQCPKCGSDMVRWGYGRMERWRCPACYRIRRKDYHGKVAIALGAPQQDGGSVTPFIEDNDLVLYNGDCLDVLRTLPDESVDCCITSPPYWGLRDYGADGQLGLEATPDQYVQNMVAVFREVRRVLADHGTCWLNLGSSYASGGTNPSQSRPPRHAPAYGSDDTAPPDSREPGSAYRDLCDECLADYLTHRDRTAGTTQPLSLDAQPAEQTARDTGLTGSVSTSPVASLPDAQASTTLQSWRQLRGECSRCASRASSLSGVRSSADDAPGFSRSSWLNYTASIKPKDMVPIPWMVAFALQADGWYLRSDIVWAKSNPMPESVTDRPTKSHEYVFLLTKKSRYYFDSDAVRETAEWSRWGDQTVPKYEGTETATGWMKPQTKEELQKRVAEGRNIRSVWNIPTDYFPGAHFATFPEELVRRCLLAGCPVGGTVLDPFSGSGTTLFTARKHQRRSIGIELNREYCKLVSERTQQLSLLA